MNKHPDFSRIHDALLRLAAKAVKFNGELYRASTPAYANTRDLLTGEGARRWGGRWNAPGIAVVYLAESFEGAIAETFGVAAHFGFVAAARLPLTLVAVDASLDRVLDLTDAKVRKALKLTLTQMNCCPWRDENAAGREAVTQAVGRAAHAAGFQGILVASSVKRSLRNLNVFPGIPGVSGKLVIRSADKLTLPPTTGAT